MSKILINSIRILFTSIRKPFQSTSLSRYSENETIIDSQSNMAFPVFGKGDDEQITREYIDFLKGQLKIYQEANNGKENIELSVIYKGIIVLSSILIVAAFIGLLVSSLIYKSPLNEAQNLFVNACNQLLNKLAPTLVGLLVGKAIK